MGYFTFVIISPDFQVTPTAMDSIVAFSEESEVSFLVTSLLPQTDQSTASLLQTDQSVARAELANILNYSLNFFPLWSGFYSILYSPCIVSRNIPIAFIAQIPSATRPWLFV